MSNKELQKFFQTIKNEARGGAPREAWIADTKDVLLMQVRNTMNVKEPQPALSRARHFLRIFFPTDMLALAGRTVGVFSLALGTIFGGGLASAQVYRDSLPGDALYGVKLAVEKTQLALSPNQDYRTRLHTEFADRRLEEVARIVESGGTTSVDTALAAFEGELRALESGLDVLRAGDADVVIDVAKLLERKAATYQGTLRKLGRIATKEARPAIAEARDIADGLTVKAVAVIVEKHIEGNAAASATVIVSKIQDRLVQVEDKLDSVDAAGEQAVASETITKARTAIAEAKELIRGEQYQAALDKIVEVAELAKEAEVAEAAEAEDAAAAADAEATDAGEATAPAPATESPTTENNATQGSTGATSSEEDAAAVGSGSR